MIYTSQVSLRLEKNSSRPTPGNSTSLRNKSEQENRLNNSMHIPNANSFLKKKTQNTN